MLWNFLKPMFECQRASFVLFEAWKKFWLYWIGYIYYLTLVISFSSTSIPIVTLVINEQPSQFKKSNTTIKYIMHISTIVPQPCLSLSHNFVFSLYFKDKIHRLQSTQPNSLPFWITFIFIQTMTKGVSILIPLTIWWRIRLNKKL